MCATPRQDVSDLGRPELEHTPEERAIGLVPSKYPSPFEGNANKVMAIKDVNRQDEMPVSEFTS